MRKSIFDDFKHMPLQEEFSVGQLSVLDLSGLSQKEQQLITAVLLRRLFDAREGTANQRYGEKDEKYLPYPAFIVLEEAHRFAPQNGEAKSKNILKTILSEGRKFGIGVCMVLAATVQARQRLPLPVHVPDHHAHHQPRR